MQNYLMVEVLDSEAKIPNKANPTDAGYDLSSVESFTLLPGERHAFRTGIKVSIPKGYYGRIAPRSGLAYKHGIDTLAGVVDCGFFGEIKCILINLGQEPYAIEVGDRIAQLIIENCADFNFIRVESLSNSQRGENGFGSTGR